MTIHAWNLITELVLNILMIFFRLRAMLKVIKFQYKHAHAHAQEGDKEQKVVILKAVISFS